MERANRDMIRDCVSASVISIMKQQRERWNELEDERNIEINVKFG